MENKSDNKQLPTGHAQLNDWELLAQFLQTTDVEKMKLLAPKLKKTYEFERQIIPESDTVYVDMMSPLEIAAANNLMSQLIVLLSSALPLSRHVRQIKNTITESRYVTAACLRAIAQGHTDVVNQLLTKPQVVDGLAELKISRVPWSSEHEDYLKRMQRPDNYPIRNNQVAIKGNVALVMAACLSDATIFNALLAQKEIATQLKESSIVAFLAATRNNNGTPKESINTQIVYKLLEIPAVYDYANKRLFDFQALITSYDNQKPQRKMQTQLLAIKEELNDELDEQELTDVETPITGTTNANTPVPYSPLPEYEELDDNSSVNTFTKNGPGKR